MKPHEEWLLKAEHDLKAAKLLSSDKDLFDTAIYHTQQCAEKSFKAFVAFHRKEIEKTHHLKLVLEACKEIDPEFSDVENDAIFLSPFATEFRYPDEDLAPDLDDLKKAISSAEKIYGFVKEKTKS